jgi:hypothetical protein
MKKVSTVMKKFKKGKLHSGKSGKIVKNPKQAIAIALSEAKMSKKRKKIMKKKLKKKKFPVLLTDKMFVEQPVEMTKPNESQKVTVKGTGKARKQTATWY